MEMDLKYNDLLETPYRLTTNELVIYVLRPMETVSSVDFRNPLRGESGLTIGEMGKPTTEGN